MNKKITLFILCLIIIIFFLIPLRIAGYGFLPDDDALRHAAKVISGKEWSEILVLRPGITMDSHAGWYAILKVFHLATGCGTEGLVVFSVIFLFLIFSLAPLIFVRRPESWLTAFLILSAITPSFFYRLLTGRPYIFTMAVFMCLLFMWPSFRTKKPPLAQSVIIIFLTALATWIHSSWYIFLFFIISFFIAREWRAGVRIGALVVLGVMLGALGTGHPIQFFIQTAGHFLRCLSTSQFSKTLVTELQPATLDVLPAIIVVLIFAWIHSGKRWDIKRIDNPVFIMASLGWIFGCVVSRFWFDCGIPALAVWLTQELEDGIDNMSDPHSFKRLAITIFSACALYLSTTGDVSSRWTWNLNKAYITEDNPELKSWLPEPGGIIYTSDMTIFYQTFYNNPKAPWRYILGFEKSMMPDDDLAIFNKILWNSGAYEAFAPWVKKMRSRDRLIVRGMGESEPRIKGLEWHYAVTGIWIGRLPEGRTKGR